MSYNYHKRIRSLKKTAPFNIKIVEVWPRPESLIKFIERQAHARPKIFPMECGIRDEWFSADAIYSFTSN
ncbi:hypothetical protein VCR15J2_470835 [Vibrio coralliirubri]|uniref:Uncharacterized protein n=1 Tax=Vibrio coralliirubri TaxID=1516159 RepID=A0AA86XKJ3_9VIBR|nr:hypothetical protein VCR31J2_1270826 [Vibrio coralliirubri]CDT70990.1 hypothetical protein VCR15J2_470835 [Vibrio coralliirubri]